MKILYHRQKNKKKVNKFGELKCSNRKKKIKINESKFIDDNSMCNSRAQSIFCAWKLSKKK